MTDPEKLVETLPLDEDQPYVDQDSGEVALYYTLTLAHPEPGFLLEIASLSRFSTGVTLKVPNNSRFSAETAIRRYLEEVDKRFIK